MGHAVQSFQMLHSVNEKRWGQVSTLLYTMWASTGTTIGNQQSLPLCHPHRSVILLYPCQEDLCQSKSHTWFLKSKSKKIAHKSSEKLHILAVHGMKYTLAPLWHMEHAPYLEGERQQFPRPHYIDLYHFTSTNNIT